MQFVLMKTDGGAHPPEKWAEVTARGVIDIAATAEDALLREAEDYRRKVTEVLTRHHELAQNHERNALAVHGPERLATEIDTGGHVPDAVDDMIALAKGTSFAGHFAKPETRAYLEQLIHEHFHHSMHIERSWHADANPDHPHSVAFKAVQADGIALLQSDDEHQDKGGREVVDAVFRATVPGKPASQREG